MPIAIDIGARAMHLVQGKAGKKDVVIKRALIEPLPPGLMKDGVIQEYGGLEMALRNMLIKYKIRDKACILTINGSHIYSRELDVPGGKEKVVDNIVTFEVNSTLNSGKDVAVEYVKAKQPVPDRPDMIHVRASAMQVEYINSYRNLLKNSGLSPLALDIHSNAVVKAVADTVINQKANVADQAMLLIDIGCETTTAYVFIGGDMIYSRIINAGGVDVDRFINNSNEVLPPDRQIEASDINLSLANLRSDDNLATALRPLVNNINEGVQRIQQFVAGRMQGKRLEQAFLFGRTALYEDFDQTLSDAFGFKAETITRLDKVVMPSDEPVAPYINAIGALIRND